MTESRFKRVFVKSDEADDTSRPFSSLLWALEKARVEGDEYLFADNAEREAHLLDIEKKLSEIGHSTEIDIHIDLQEPIESYDLDPHMETYIKCHRVLEIVRRELAALQTAR